MLPPLLVYAEGADLADMANVFGVGYDVSLVHTLRPWFFLENGSTTTSRVN
jgi:hypothetical protein